VKSDRHAAYYDATDERGQVTAMARTRISPKFQVVIPKEIRDRHGLKAGQEMQVISKGNAITLIPDRPLSAFRGTLRGMSTSGYREKEDRQL